MSRLARLLLVIAVPAVVLGLSKFHAAHVADPAYDFTDSSRLTWAFGFTAVGLLGSYVVGLPTLVRGPRESFIAAGAAVGLSVGSVSATQLLLGDALLPRFVVFGSAVLLVPLLGLIGLVGARGQRQVAGRDRILFVGGRSEAAQLREDLEGPVERPATLLAALDLSESVALRSGSAITERIDAIGANLLVIDVGAQANHEVVTQAAVAHESGVRIRTLSMFYEEWLGKLPLSELERISLLFDVGEVHRARYSRMKRVFDVAVGSVGCVVLLVVTPIVLIGNLFGNRGPLLFHQERVGKGGVSFTMHKFRTMRHGTSDGTWTSVGDERITRFGRLLRVSHMDELPQVVNILRGDLSLVGPRPEQPRYVEELSEKLPFYKVRHLVRPGLTGWAQVKYGYAGDERDALHKLQYEFFYLRRQSLMFDARIFARTLRHLGSGGGR